MSYMKTLADRPSTEREMIPRTLLWGMLALALSALAITSFAVLTDRPATGKPLAGTVIAERELILEGRSAQAVTVYSADGTLLADMDHGGFITVIQNAIQRARTVARVEGNPPIKIVKYDNGRLVAEDPASGASIELYAFGGDNKAAVERLLDQK
ncbi:MAG: photosynthetic complex assembly protein PuhC [Tabrizicola sp.]|uniref:photosynthetic complex assembly protein PuhC n=1 Tax=Tabrizicola sp. TaxID=2005166 RepID=UPI002AB9A32F|nr:photosynthetic complex assembly protein PuhC [Tabrizicola sp.]MDZ4089215.1 photosynthetic complex assembly protein PuhC [Tabrizicola sp.]